VDVFLVISGFLGLTESIIHAVCQHCNEQRTRGFANNSTGVMLNLTMKLSAGATSFPLLSFRLSAIFPPAYPKILAMTIFMRVVERGVRMNQYTLLISRLKYGTGSLPSRERKVGESGPVLLFAICPVLAIIKPLSRI
jgi:hypothetical protein